MQTSILKKSILIHFNYQSTRLIRFQVKAFAFTLTLKQIWKQQEFSKYFSTWGMTICCIKNYFDYLTILPLLTTLYFYSMKWMSNYLEMQNCYKHLNAPWLAATTIFVHLLLGNERRRGNFIVCYEWLLQYVKYVNKVNKRSNVLLRYL